MNKLEQEFLELLRTANPRGDTSRRDGEFARRLADLTDAWAIGEGNLAEKEQSVISWIDSYSTRLKKPTKGAGKKRMTQSEVFNHFAEKTGMKRGQVKEFFDELYNLASGQVKSNGEFVLPGFGKLVKAERKAREGRNPATGKTIQVPAKTTLKFRIGKSMKDTVLPRK